MKMRLQAQAIQGITPTNSVEFSNDDIEVGRFSSFAVRADILATRR